MKQQKPVNPKFLLELKLGLRSSYLCPNSFVDSTKTLFHYQLNKMMKNAVIFVALIVCLALVPINTLAQRKKSLQLDSLFMGAHQNGVFNGNVLIVEKEKVLLQASYGYADAAGLQKLDADYRFNIGSIAKEFNAVGIMMLKESGQLSLSDKVSKFLSDLPQWADSITVLNLLQYTSGIPNSNWKEIKGDADNYAFLKQVKKLDFVPGTKYAYNNNNTFLQRQIIESISGISFGEFVRQEILKPLRMKASIVDPTAADQKIARSYNNAKIQDDLTPPISGWTSVTSDDFLKWANAITNFKLISPKSTNEILKGYAAGNQAGLGGGTMEGTTLKYHIHDGTTRNYQALLVTHNDTKRVVILLTNNHQNNLYAFNRSIQALLDGKPYGQIRKSFLNNFKTQVENMTGDRLLAFYAEMKEKSPDEFSFGSEDSLNEIGYHYLRNGKITDAIVVLKANTKLFPSSGNAFDSLAEAYLKSGSKMDALANYQKAYQLDPNNNTAKNMIAELSIKP